MNLWKPLGYGGALVLLLVLPACRTSPPSAESTLPVPPEVVQQDYLYEVVRHLYRWQLDEVEIEKLVGAKEITFWVRRLQPRLDPGDRSQFAEILLPQVLMRIKVKKADYTIEELGTVVRGQTFKITQVLRSQQPFQQPSGCAVIRVDMKELREYLFRTRNQRDFPDAELVERLRTAVRQEAAKQGILQTNTPMSEQIVYLAPLSPVANETWVFWETGRKLLYFASDIDLANPAVWKHETLMARIYDLDTQVVVSHEEAAGSNRFLTRYQVSRALFNCLIFGQRLALQPRQQAALQTPAAAAETTEMTKPGGGL
jgi:hypothetical protein